MNIHQKKDPRPMHVAVFLPAYNEQDIIGQVIARIPRLIDSMHRVSVIVIDDGSQDDTVTRSKEAGADHVYSFPVNRGLGAAVRQGLQEAFRLGADIGVMLDADNEYPPESIPDLIAPIIHGEADYVMGSRFLGHIRGMKLHRRLGNYFFSFLQSLLIRKWIYDGQSGMRAFSRQAMQQAEIIHDYNYAQVLTLNLISKGFRIQEIPIPYQVRTTGKSFIKGTTYVCKVFPAIWRELRNHRARQKQSKPYVIQSMNEGYDA